MNRTISISLLIFWAMQFALHTVAAIKGLPLALLSPFDDGLISGYAPQHGFSMIVLGVVSGLIAAVFAWAAIASASEVFEPDGASTGVIKLAFSMAILAVSILVVVNAMQGIMLPFEPVAMIVVALCVSWLTTARDGACSNVEESGEAGEGHSRLLASRMAGEVAHKTMLGTISRRARKAGEAS